VPVKTGISDGKHVEIVGGELKAGDRVAVQYRATGSGGGSGAAGGRMRAF
jgi:multidrug efflux pump subunit AcrA (membrane-fusion protein)